MHCEDSFCVRTLKYLGFEIFEVLKYLGFEVFAQTSRE